MDKKESISESFIHMKINIWCDVVLLNLVFLIFYLIIFMTEHKPRK